MQEVTRQHFLHTTLRLTIAGTIKTYIPDREHILWEGQFSSPPQAQISEASTVKYKNKLKSSELMYVDHHAAKFNQ